MLALAGLGDCLGELNSYKWPFLDRVQSVVSALLAKYIVEPHLSK